MVRTVRAVTAIAVTAAAVLASSPAALAESQHFVLFSNRSIQIKKSCYTSYDLYGQELAHDCDSVRAYSQSTFWVPADASYTWVYVDDDENTKDWQDTIYNNRDLCLRASYSGSVHEATEQPCTPD